MSTEIKTLIHIFHCNIFLRVLLLRKVFSSGKLFLDFRLGGEKCNMKKKLIITTLLGISICFLVLAEILWMGKSKEAEKKENNSNNEIVLNTDKNENDIQINTENTDKEESEEDTQMESKKESEEKTDREDVKNEVTNKSSDTSEDSKKEAPEKHEEPEKPKVCQHSYDRDIEPSNCTKDGLITYTCTKCNNTYTEVIKADHAFEKYLCAYCGKIDPQSSPCWAMSAWIQRFGEMNGAETMCGYPNFETALKVYCHLGLDTIYLGYEDDSIGEQFKVVFHTTDSCTVIYSLGETRGLFTASNSALSSSMAITFEDFSTPEENPVDEAEFATTCASKIDHYMHRIQNEIMPNTGVGLSFFGFNY